MKIVDAVAVRVNPIFAAMGQQQRNRDRERTGERAQGRDEQQTRDHHRERCCGAPLAAGEAHHRAHCLPRHSRSAQHLRQPPAQDDDQADHRDLIHHRNTQQVNGIAGSGQQNEERRDDRDHCRNAEDDRPPLTAGTGSLRFTPKSGQWLRGHDGRGQ